MNVVLKSELSRHVVELAQSPKAAVVVSAGTGATGTLTMFDLLSNNIGVIATTLAAVLSLTLIVGNVIRIVKDIKHDRQRLEKSDLEIMLLKQKTESQGGSK